MIRIEKGERGQRSPSTEYLGSPPRMCKISEVTRQASTCGGLLSFFDVCQQRDNEATER